MLIFFFFFNIDGASFGTNVLFTVHVAWIFLVWQRELLKTFSYGLFYFFDKC